MTNDDDKPNRQQAPVQYPFGHLIPGPDPRTPEEREAAQRKETKRRRGKIRGREVRWWEGI